MNRRNFASVVVGGLVGLVVAPVITKTPREHDLTDFTKALKSIEKSKTQIHRGKLTDFFITNEAMEDIRNWVPETIEEHIRKDFFMKAVPIYE